MFVRMDLLLRYSQKRNFFHFFEQKKQNFQKQGVFAPHAPPIYAPNQNYRFLIVVCIKGLLVIKKTATQNSM